MSNEVVKWSERLKSSAKEVAALERPSLSVLSVRSGMLMYMGQPVPGNKLQVVIVASSFQNRYYDKPFDPNNPANPVCFSLSADGVDMAPHEDSPEKQAEECTGCPMNEWGSDPKGGRGKACKAARRLAVVPASIVQGGSDAIKKAEMAMLTLPVTSAKNWGNYVNGLAGEYERPPWGVITEISVAPDPKTQFKVNFETKGLVEEENLGAVYSRIEPAMLVLLTPYEEQAEKQPEKKPKEGTKY